MIAAALLAQTQLWWRQFAWLIEQLGAAAEQPHFGEVVVYTGRDWAGMWVMDDQPLVLTVGPPWS